MIPWRSNQGRRCGGSGPSAKSGADSTGETSCTKTGGRTELDRSTGELYCAMRALGKAEEQAAARAVPNAVRAVQKPCTSHGVRLEPSGAHEAVGLSAAAGNAQLEAAARLAALQAALHPFAGNGLRHQPTTGAAGGAPEPDAQSGGGELRGHLITLRSQRS